MIEDKRGTLWGVGIGPGDPELITLKAVRIIQSCPVIAVPETYKKNTLALDILQKTVDLSQKRILTLTFPMSRDRRELDANYLKQADLVMQVLKLGQDAAMISLGDVSLYSTFGYIADIVSVSGFKVEAVPGITSFCAGAARLRMSLVQWDESLQILSASDPELTAALNRPGTKIIMKPQHHFDVLRDILQKSGKKVSAVTNCGLDGEKIYSDLSEIPENPGYFTLLFISDQIRKTIADSEVK